MKKKRFIIILISIVIAVICILAYAIAPLSKIEYYTFSKEKTLADSLMNISGAKLNSKSLEMKLNEEDINEVISTVKGVDKYRIILKENYADIYIPVQLFKFINTDLKVSCDVKSEDNKIRITIKESRLGKIKINNKYIKKYVKEGTYNNFIVEKVNNNIFISSRLIDFNEVHIQKHELFVKCKLNLKGIMDELTNRLI